jgi:hypothetical protein
MPELPQKVIIRTYAPVRRWIVIVTLTAVALLGSYLLYEYGRYIAGYDRLEALRVESQLQAEIDQRDATIRDLRRVSADFETFKASQGRERSELARSIGELQAQVGRQSQDLSFYKGIVVQSANAPDVKIQQLRIARGADPTRFVLHLTLVQPVRPDAVVNGAVTLIVDGQQGATPARLGLDALTAAGKAELSYSFRYFENLDPEIVIPAEFRPERVTVEVRSSRRGVTPLTQTFLWTVEAT